jgi:ABC-type transport system involved in multi-copper enzyme maturation permease subunit
VKYLALLKDSVREAIDTKVFYVMLAASCVLVLVVASMSFRPLPVDALSDLYTIEPLSTERSQLARFAGGLVPFFSSSDRWKRDRVEPLDEAPDSPDSPLQFTIQEILNPQAAKKVMADPAETKELIRQRFGSFGDWKVFEVTHVELLPAQNERTVRFAVSTRPTSATRRIWPCEPSLFFGQVALPAFKDIPLGTQLYFIEGSLVNNLGAWVAILVSIVITAFFIPNMLRKGTVELLLVKPLHRSTLLLYKYLGGLVFILLNTTFVVGGVWLALGLRSGVWAGGFLLTILIITGFFAILYSASTLFAVLTGSPIVSILLTCLVWFIFWAAGVFYMMPDTLRQINEQQQRAERWRERNKAKGDDPVEKSTPAAPDAEAAWVTAAKVIHFVLPRTSDLNYLTDRLLLNDLLEAKQVDPRQLQTAKFSWGESLSVNAVFVTVMLGLSCLRFRLKDY